MKPAENAGKPSKPEKNRIRFSFTPSQISVSTDSVFNDLQNFQSNGLVLKIKMQTFNFS